jgi:hypothetical protein
MARTELVIIIAIAFFLTFLLGWVLRWAYGRVNSVNTGSVNDIDDLATRLHLAEEERDEAISRLESREWELTNQISQAEAELSAAMGGLGEARRENEALRNQIEGA